MWRHECAVRQTLWRSRRTREFVEQVGDVGCECGATREEAQVRVLLAVLALIDREASHARAGRPSSIKIKVNGLSDAEVVHALYRAADAGVKIDLIVRGICTLRPVSAGGAEQIRVVSVVGRWLEHSRIYRFENHGAPDYLIGSSDLRPRNLRRRVELLVPILNAEHRARLDQILDMYLTDATGWDLATDGRYAQRDRGAIGAQTALAHQASSLASVPE